MRHIPIFALVTVVAASWLAAAQLVQSPASGNNEVELRGRIVLYDWVLHETTSTDDFVLKTMNNVGVSTPYARVIYRPHWGFDAPATATKDVLDRWAFVGRGTKWSLVVHMPLSREEQAACSSPIANHKYEDETGSGEIQRFVPTPGSDIEGTPPVSSLPCFILKRGGLTRTASEPPNPVRPDRRLQAERND